MNIPKCMSTQHPDNVSSPFFARNIELSGEDEIQEAYYAFSNLKATEQMWDCEGKEVDNYVVKKLLSRYETFFRQSRLGKEIFLTLRVPNPTVEKAEAKILLETLESIPRSFDASKLFYSQDIAPIFEVIVPMAATAQSIDRIYRYYSDFVVGKQHKSFKEGDITIADWIGEFKPSTVNVIPLFEEMGYMLEAHNITKEYLKDKKVKYQRVFLAHSDPAMNYGMINSMLLNKIALQRLHKMSKDIGVEIYPILGLGSAPFRGNLTPHNVQHVLNEFPSVQTFTIQSAFKYDHAPEDVTRAIAEINQHQRSVPHQIDEERCLDIIKRYANEYQRQIVALAPVINQIAKFVPARRKRKLHVGLFGYARNMQGVTLPRAITFTSAFYSIGFPPELLGLNALTKEDIKFLREVYMNFDNDLSDALRFLNTDSPFLLPEIKSSLDHLSLAHVKVDTESKKLTSLMCANVKDNRHDSTADYLLKTASIRKFLG